MTDSRSQPITADTLVRSGWTNSWIDGVRRWHHKTLPAHFKSLAEAKNLYREYQAPGALQSSGVARSP